MDPVSSCSSIPRPPWRLVVVLGIGVFLGSFWILLGLVTLIGSGAPFLAYVSVLSPGAGIIVLVLSARRAPVPFGVGLITAGALYLGFAVWRLAPLAGVVLGFPVMVLGALFIAWRRRLH